MGLQDIARHGPFTMEIKFSIVNDQGDTAELSFDCPPGNIPPPHGVAILAEKALVGIREAIPERTWRFPTRAEFVQAQLQEQAGTGGMVKFAVPEGEFEAEWARP